MRKTKITKHDVQGVEVTIEQDIDTDAQPPVVRCVAICGRSRVQSSHSLHPKHDREADHLKKDHDEFLQRLAEEAAGHEKSRNLLDAFAESE